MSAIQKLTARKVTRLAKPGKYGDGNGLYLQITKRQGKSWLFRYTVNGREHGMGLGPLRKVNLAQARAAARAARALLERGIDPLQAHVAGRAQGAEEATPTPVRFDDCAAVYIASHRESWRSEKHRRQWASVLQTYASPHFGALDVRLVDTSLVLQALMPIWHTKITTASRLRERIARVLAWATTSGYRTGENPARWHRHLEELLPRPSKIRRVCHYPSLPYGRVSAFLAVLHARHTPGALPLAFTILTACRSSEVLRAVWEEIDFDARLWTIPGERIKSGHAHRVPLSGAALAILEAQAGRDPVWVFPGFTAGKPLSDSTMRTALYKTGWSDVTVHGFRSTFRVWAAERGTPKDVAELSLAHAVGSAVEAAYQRSDLIEARRTLMQDWADWCAVSA